MPFSSTAALTSPQFLLPSGQCRIQIRARLENDVGLALVEVHLDRSHARSSGHGLGKSPHTRRAIELGRLTSRITNGLLEGINSIIKAAKAKARGYRTTRNLITVAYLLAGKLDLTPCRA